MADGSDEIPDKMNFDCWDPPKGMTDYFSDQNQDLFTNDQQSRLNDYKISTVRENQQYLADHPEVGAMVALIFRHLMKLRPKTNFYEIIATRFFCESQVDLREEIIEYLTEHNMSVEDKPFGREKVVYKRHVEEEPLSWLTTAVGEDPESNAVNINDILEVQRRSMASQISFNLFGRNSYDQYDPVRKEDEDDSTRKGSQASSHSLSSSFDLSEFLWLKHKLASWDKNWADINKPEVQTVNSWDTIDSLMKKCASTFKSIGPSTASLTKITKTIKPLYLHPVISDDFIREKEAIPVTPESNASNTTIPTIKFSLSSSKSSNTIEIESGEGSVKSSSSSSTTKKRERRISRYVKINDEDD